MVRRCLLSGLALLVLTGCPSNDFESETLISPDGSVTRTVRYSASEEGRNELGTRYVLPEGGTWHARKATDYDGSTGETSETIVQVYTATRTFSPGEAIPSDHIRKGGKEGRMLRNELELARTSYFFVTFFDYREIHGEPGRTERLLAALEKRYPAWKSELAANLAANLEQVDRPEALRAVQAVCDPWVGRLRDGIYVEELVRLEDMDVEGALTRALLGELPPPSSHGGADAWTHVIGQAVRHAMSALEDDEELEDILFGVYDCFPFCGRYGFTQILSMPGTLLSSNATSAQDNQLVWEFESAAFQVQDYVLRARSRVVHRARIAGAGFVLVPLFGYALVRARHRLGASR